MEVGISSRAPLLLNGGGNGIVKSKGIGNGSGVGVGAHPMRHHHIGIKTEEPDSSLTFGEETTTAVSVSTKQHLLNLNVTRCPICQKFVLDLPQHISLTHHQPRPASAMVLPTPAAAAAINLVKKEDNSGAPINLSVRNNNNDSVNNNHSPPLRGVSPSSKSSPVAALALAAAAVAAANSNGVALIGSRVPSDDISSSGESSVGSGYRSPSSASMTPVQITTAAAADLTASAALVSAGEDTPRKRRKQTHVPDSNKDERYWTRRLKNNEAAKRSRDMRIKRERVVFEENQRLENMNKELRLEMDKFITENKELRLKNDIVMEDNARLKNLLISYQTADQERRRSMEQAEDARPGKPVLLLKEDV